SVDKSIEEKSKISLINHLNARAVAILGVSKSLILEACDFMKRRGRCIMYFIHFIGILYYIIHRHSLEREFMCLERYFFTSR
ncbi:hypothetical protein, partial [Bartonella sp. AD328YNZD]|uniref:hypothetical protein n=1 Tax=Bartonella sp. AD328YNZD TaxID=3243464 RepID=UPI0035D0FFE1